MAKISEHYEVYCVPCRLKTRTFLTFREAVKVYDEHLLDCQHKRQAQLVRIRATTPQAWRDVMLP